MAGRPGEGNGSGLSCASYQAGSIHSSATQRKSAPVGAAGGADVADVAGGGTGMSAAGWGGDSGLGMLPVVKS